MNKLFIIGMLTAAIAMPLVAHADPTGDCTSKGTPALGEVDTGLGFYVDDRNYLLGNGLWVYQEANNDPGLQRGGQSQLVPNDPEICSDNDPNGPDQLIL